MKSSSVVKKLGALAQESRLSVFRLLVQAGPDGLNPGALASKLKIPAPTLSFHLKELTASELVSLKSRGREKIYSIDFKEMSGLVEFLYDNCCGVGVTGCGPECIPKINFAKTTLSRGKNE